MGSMGYCEDWRVIRMEHNFTYEDGYEDGCVSKESEILDILVEMQLENKFDIATIDEIKKRLGD